MDIDIVDEDDLEILEVTNNNESISADPVHVVKREIVKNTNPVEEHLIKQLQCAQSQIDQAKSNIEVIQTVTDRILKDLATKAAYRDEPSSDSDSDFYTTTGEPVIKMKRNKRYEKRQVLIIKEIWQRVTDDKWVIGVVVKSTTLCALKELTLYVCPKGSDDSCHGVSVFWQLADGTYWYPTDVMEPGEQLVATAVLALPEFDRVGGRAQLNATIFCELDDKLFQTPLPLIELGVQDAIDPSFALGFDDKSTARFSLIALKAISVDRVVLVPVKHDSNTGAKLINFLKKYSFDSVCKSCVVRDNSVLHHCMFEIMPLLGDDPDMRILISARSEAQLSVVVQLLRESFPDLMDVEKQQSVDEAADALCQELKLYLNGATASELQRARVKTDLLIS